MCATSTTNTPCAAPRRDALADFLKQRGIGTMIYYPLPLHLQGLYADLGMSEGSLPNVEAAAREVISLPMYPEITEAQQQEIVGAIAEFYEISSGEWRVEWRCKVDWQL